MSRITKKTREFLETARGDPLVNKTELATILQTKGKVVGLHSELEKHQMWEAFDFERPPKSDPFIPYRAKVYSFTEPEYSRISAYMACPARLDGPSACLTCKPELLIPCYLDNLDLLPETDMSTMMEKLNLSRSLSDKGYTSNIILKFSDLDAIRTVLEHVNTGTLPDLSDTANTSYAEIWNAVPDKGITAAETERQAKEALEKILETYTTNGSSVVAEEPEPEKKPAKKRGRPRKTAAAKTEEAVTPKKTTKKSAKTASEPPTVDMTPVIAELGRMNTGIQTLLENEARGTSLSGLLLSSISGQEAKLKFLGERLLQVMLLVDSPAAVESYTAEWQGLFEAGSSIDDYQDLSDSELSKMCESQGAPETVLESRNSMLGWLAAN
tara:strand:+ start:7978 stop:9129 length:1152 start_codon:yes stop_codon:yes gene_type:complete